MDRRGRREILLNPAYAGNLLSQKTYTTDVLPFKRKRNHGEKPHYFVEDDHEPLIASAQVEAVKEIMEYRSRQYKLTSEHCTKRYAFSGKILCGECEGTFRRQKIYISKSYETVHWCCSRYIADKTECGQKAVREDALQRAFVVMWNKLAGNSAKILLPLLDVLEKLRMDEQQEREIEACNSRIMELTEQGHILSRLISQGYMEPAVSIERQNTLVLELAAARKKRNQLLDSNGFDREIERTELLLKLVEKYPGLLEEYNEEIFLQSVRNVMISDGKITFRLVNGLELTEIIGIGGNQHGAAAHAHRL